jgi:prevent-host-death family protein
VKTIAIGKFKAECLALISGLVQTHEEIIITKHGRPVAKVIPYETDKEREAKPLKGLATFVGDIVSPIDEKWEANK